MHLIRSLIAAGLVATAAAACSDQTATPTGSTPEQDQPGLAPVLRPQNPQDAVDGSYIVMMREGADPAALAARTEIQPRHVYRHAVNGFAAELGDAEIALLRRNSDVLYIEQDQVMHVAATQSGATWGLDRIDQRNLPLNGTYTYTPTGAGVTAYVIDTGIRPSHNEFGGRAQMVYGSADCHGHGTHVAGTIGGSTYGVAKGVAIRGVRVLDCNGNGYTSDIIAGVDWVRNNHVKPAVANMSLGGGASTSMDNAVNNLINAGVITVVAAGNENQNACNVSPSRVANAITVGATSSNDARWVWGSTSGSNYGSCVDVFAPGDNITSAWYNSNSATNTITGTSMASPHVAGVAALYLQGNSTASQSTVANAITSTATTGVISNVGSGSPNRLLYSPLSGSGGGTPPPTGTTYTGSLSGTGDYDYQPNGNYYYSASSGTHSGTLSGPGSADFDLYLWKWNGSSWSTVASSLSSSSSESITYNGSAGYYVWRIYSYSGSGSYTFTLSKP